MEKMDSGNCGPGCNCGKPSGNTKFKAVVSLIVLLVIGGIFVYKAKCAKQTIPVNMETVFVTPAVKDVNEPKSAVSAVEPVTKPDVIEQETAAQPGDKLEPVSNAAEEKKRVGEVLDSLASLNNVAINQDAVLVFIPAKDSDIISKETLDVIASAEQKIKSRGVSLGLYTLQSSSPEYANIATQLTLPGMLVMSKGRGMGAVSGGITEEKILQAYVASSRAGGCGPSGCGPSSSGCGPSAPVGPRVQ